jgi:hypothetical protein
MLDEGSGSVFTPVWEEDEASVMVMPGAGVPESGDPDASDAEAGLGRPRGSEECWRLSYRGVSNVRFLQAFLFFDVP